MVWSSKYGVFPSCKCDFFHPTKPYKSPQLQEGVNIGINSLAAVRGPNIFAGWSLMFFVWTLIVFTFTRIFGGQKYEPMLLTRLKNSSPPLNSQKTGWKIHHLKMYCVLELRWISSSPKSPTHSGFWDYSKIYKICRAELRSSPLSKI